MNNVFDREILNARERPLSSDHNQQWAQQWLTFKEMFRYYGFSQDGFVLDGFYPTFTANTLEVQLAAGIGWFFDGTLASNAIGGISNLDDRGTYFPVLLKSPQLLTLAAAPGGGLERYDLIEVKVDRRAQDPGSRDILDPSTGIFAATSVNKILAYDLDGRTGTVSSPSNSTTGIGIKTGVVAATGTAVVPAVSPGYKAVAVCYVPNGTTTLTKKIRDMRRVLLSPGMTSTFAFTVVETMGAPGAINAIPGLTAPGTKPSSLRVGAKLLGAGLNPGLRIFIIAGDLTSRPVILNSKPYSVPSGGGTDLVDIMASTSSISGAGTLSSGDATSLQAAPSSLDVMAGQPVVWYDLQALSISGANPAGGDIITHLCQIML